MLTNSMKLQRWTKLTTSVFLNITRDLSNKTCIFTKIRRTVYLRQYPTLMVRPDGSTFTARYHEPRGIIKFPLDLSKLSEAEKLAVLENRKPRKKIKYQKEETIPFNYEIYLNYYKKK